MQLHIENKKTSEVAAEKPHTADATPADVVAMKTRVETASAFDTEEERQEYIAHLQQKIAENTAAGKSTKGYEKMLAKHTVTAELLKNHGNPSEEKHDALAETLKDGGMKESVVQETNDAAAMKQINAAASERIAAKKNVEVAETKESEITPEKLAAEKAEIIAEGEAFYKYNQSNDLQTIGHLPQAKMDSIQKALEATERDEKMAAYMKKTGQDYKPGDWMNIPSNALAEITNTFPQQSHDEFLKAQEVIAAKIIVEVQKDPELLAQVTAAVHESKEYQTRLKKVEDKIAAYNEKLLKYSVDSGDSKTVDTRNMGRPGKMLIPGELLTEKITDDNLNLGGSNDPTYLAMGAIAQQKVFKHFKSVAEKKAPIEKARDEFKSLIEAAQNELQVEINKLSEEYSSQRDGMVQDFEKNAQFEPHGDGRKLTPGSRTDYEKMQEKLNTLRKETANKAGKLVAETLKKDPQTQAKTDTYIDKYNEYLSKATEDDADMEEFSPLKTGLTLDDEIYNVAVSEFVSPK